MGIRKEKPPTTEVPCLSGVYWIVEKDDTLWRISQQIKVSIEKILEANPGLQPDRLRIGQRICVPDPVNKVSLKHPFNRP
ncbi:MAG: LysM domain-containing protein [Clostridia bacterium]|nr:LysM domain-containing protein [Clostridia bacterium]